MAGTLKLQVTPFKKDTYINVEGKPDANRFYIIKEGQVQISRISEVIEEDTGNILYPGDFFGVVSCMSNHASIETAKALKELLLICVYREQFDLMIQKHSAIAMKIITSFSHKLRFFDSAITRLSFKGNVEEDPKNLFKIGKYYLEKNQNSHAFYAFKKFIQYCPNDPGTHEAKQLMLKLQPQIKGGGATKVQQGFNRQYEDNEIIFLEHEPGDELYIIQKGKIKITKIVDNNEVMLAMLKPGDIFGEMAILENKPRSATVLSSGDSVLLAVNKANFEAMVQKNPQLGTRLITLLSERIWKAYRQLANILITNPLGRLFDTLLTIVEENRVPIVHNGSFSFDFGPDELVKMCGLATDEGNVLVQELFKNSKVKLEDNKIIVTDLQELVKQVEFYKKMDILDRKRQKPGKRS
jgi:CRP/FNR family transcriptional regulator